MSAPHELIQRLLDGDRAALARVLTLIERRPAEAPLLDDTFASRTGGAATVGVTGSPGAGKSTLVGSLLKAAVQRNERVAVLALDPISSLTRGAVLGDRVRMEHTTADPRVFVRSMTADNGAGGLALATPFAIRALDAAGWPWVFVETVGVGQAEFDVVEAATTTIVVLTPAAGDEIQAIKAGLMEMADIFVLNKADLDGAQSARFDLERAVQRRPGEAWKPPIVESVASQDRGTEEVWDAIGRHRLYLRESGTMAKRQQRLLLLALRGLLNAEIERRVSAALAARDLPDMLATVQMGELGIGRLSRIIRDRVAAQGAPDPP